MAVTSTNITWLHRASVAAAAVSAALAVWSWWPGRTGGETTMVFVPMWLAVLTLLPGMIAAIRRQPDRNHPLAMWRLVRWFLRDAPRWAAALWFLSLAGAMLAMLTVMKPGRQDVADVAHVFPVAAFYFAITGVLLYRALAREQRAEAADRVSS